MAKTRNYKKSPYWFIIIGLFILVQGCAFSKPNNNIKVRTKTTAPITLNQSNVDINSLTSFKQANDSVRYITYSTLRRLGLNDTAEFIEACSDGAVEQIVEPLDESRTVRSKAYTVKFSLDMDKQNDKIFFCIIITW